MWRRVETRYRYLRANPSLKWWLLGGVAGLLLLGALWIVGTGLVARSDLEAIKTRLSAAQKLVQQGNVDEAEKVAAGIPALAERAHRLTTGPAWFLASEVPYLGRPLQIVRGTTAATDELGSHGVVTLLDVIGTLDPSKLRLHGDTINLAPIEAAAPKLALVASAIDRAQHSLNSVPSSSWLSQIDTARASMSATLDRVAGYVDAANRAAQVLPGLLGQDGPKRYFIGLQNEAEMRGTGGLPGAFAIVVADHGTVKFTHFESDAVLEPSGNSQLVATGLDFGPDFERDYGATQATSLYVNSNISPNFPYAAQIWAAMWQRVSGEQVDGALAMDPQVLANLLTATGPIKTANGAALSADTVVPLTEQQEYAIFSDTALRKQFLVDVLKTVSQSVISGQASATSLIRSLSVSASEHRMLVWVRDAHAQQVIEQTDYSGAVPTSTHQSFVGLVLNNEAAGKLDYYLQRSIQYVSTGCGRSRDVYVTISLTNGAPGSGLPAYVTTRLDSDRPAGVQPGDNRTLVDYYATSGAQLASVTVNGKPSTASVADAFNHPIFRLDMELPHGTTSTIVLHLVEPRTAGAPVVWYQPGVNPLATDINVQPC